KVELPDLGETLPAAFGRAAQLRQPVDHAAPCVTGLPYVVAVDFRAVEQATKTRHPLRAPSPERFGARVPRLADCRREITRGELPVRVHEPTDRILECLAGTGRPDQEPDEAVAHEAQRRFLAAKQDGLKIIERIGAAGKCEERQRDPGNVPEIPSG